MLVGMVCCGGLVVATIFAHAVRDSPAKLAGGDRVSGEGVCRRTSLDSAPRHQPKSRHHQPQQKKLSGIATEELSSKKT